MKYLVIGAGGTGGSIGAYLSRNNKDVTLIARGEHLRCMQENGLKVETPKESYTVSVKACEMSDYNEKPDVIFVCVKGYSLEDTIPFIERISDEKTIVIPILNIYGTGGRMAKSLPKPLVTDGCIYVAAEIKEPGCILMKGTILKVVYGVRSIDDYRPELLKIKEDLLESSIEAVLSDDIRRDALQKFSFVSPMGSCGLYHDVSAGAIQEAGEIRETFIKLVKEIEALAEAMDIHFLCDIVKTNLEILDALAPTSSTSMQRDIRDGKSSEIDGLIYEVIRLGKEYKVDLPMYSMVAEKTKSMGL